MRSALYIGYILVSDWKKWFLLMPKPEKSQMSDKIVNSKLKAYESNIWGSLHFKTY